MFNELLHGLHKHKKSFMKASYQNLTL